MKLNESVSKGKFTQRPCHFIVVSSIKILCILTMFRVIGHSKKSPVAAASKVGENEWDFSFPS